MPLLHTHAHIAMPFTNTTCVFCTRMHACIYAAWQRLHDLPSLAPAAAPTQQDVEVSLTDSTIERNSAAHGGGLECFQCFSITATG